ncbi:hypothetical protein LBMAG49_13770 [Planctomycetota bacterium]|nr:hypothetical protein LBMAG49_13770 [Planctomycetota bacterium]
MAKQSETETIHHLPATVLGILAALAAVASVAWAQGPAGPTPAECFAADAAASMRGYFSMAASLLAALLTAILLTVRLLPARFAADGFACLASVVFASGLPLLCGSLSCSREAWTGPIAASLIAFGSALLSSVAAPLARDRSVLVLGIVAACASLPTLTAVRFARSRSFEARELVALVAQAAPDRLSGDGVALLVEAGLRAEVRRAVPLALRPPFRATALHVMVAESGTIAAQWLQRMEWPVLRLQNNECTRLPAAAINARLSAGELAVQGLVARTAGLALDIVIHGKLAMQGSVVILFTPVGEFLLPWQPAQPGDFTAPSGLDPLLRERFVALDSLASGFRIRAVVVPPDKADLYGFCDLPL